MDAAKLPDAATGSVSTSDTHNWACASIESYRTVITDALPGQRGVDV